MFQFFGNPGVRCAAALLAACPGAGAQVANAQSIDGAREALPWQARAMLPAEAGHAPTPPCAAPRPHCTGIANPPLTFELALDPPASREAPKPWQRNGAELMLGARYNLPNSRAAWHGPWFVQFRVTRHAPDVRASLPLPRHTAGALNIGITF